MTSDRGNSGAAELQLTPTSVTQKSPGLNPNATEFLSKQDVHHWDDINADGLYQYANGDINKLEASSGVFSPAAASEAPLQSLAAEFTPTGATGTGPGSSLLTAVSPVTAPPSAAADQTVSSAVSTGPAAGAAGGGAGTGPSAGAGTILANAGIPTTSSPLIYSSQTETATLQDESATQVDGTLSDDQIRRMLKSQLEYYFSRENLTSDTYLMSQMDADQYVAISAVASFGQVQRLTSNLDLVVDVLRECQNVQVDEKGEKVRPNHNRCIVILREIPATTPVEEVENLFSGSNCPKFVSCEFAHNDSWYVTFDSDEDAQRAYQYLREEVKSFLGKPIMARIKAKPLIRPSYVPRNGLKPHFEQQTFPSPQRYAFVPNLQYGQQVFYHPGHAVLSSWAPAAPTIMDPSMVFAMNGYQAAGVKLNAHGRHQFANLRVSRTPKPHRNLNQERASSDSRLSHDRHQNPNAHRSSPRSTENAHVTAAPFLQRKSSDNSSHHNHPLHHLQHSNNPGAGGGGGGVGNSGGVGGGVGGGLPTSVPVHHSSAAAESSTSMNVSLLPDSSKDSTVSQPQRKPYNKGRRKKDEDYSKLSRQNSSQISANNKYTEPQFEFESNSFPPLPGSQNNAASGEKFENKLSDVVRGTAKPLAKESVITSPVVTATALTSSSPSTSSPSSSATGAAASAAAVVVAPLSASSSSAAVGLHTQPPAAALATPASKEVSTAVATSMLAPSTSSTSSASASSSAAASTAAVVSSLVPASAAAVLSAPAAPHLPLIASSATSTLSSSASATSANNRTLAQTSQPVCPANKQACSIPSSTGKLNSVNTVDHNKSTDGHSVSLLGSSQPHPVAVVNTPPTAASVVATTTACSKETSGGSSTLSTLAAHTPPVSSCQSVSVSSLSLSSSSSGHGIPVSASGSSSSQQGHSRPGQAAAASQGMTTSSAVASGSPAALTAVSVANPVALQQHQQNTKNSALEEKATSKLSYAQMVARKRDPGNDGGSALSSSSASSDKCQAPASQQTPNAAASSSSSLQQQQQQQAHSAPGGEQMCKMVTNKLLQPSGSLPSQRSQALKEQSQALKVSPSSATHSQLPPKEHILRKDLEPKEQRFNLSGRRPAKENRERQRRKTDRERTSK